MIIILLSVIAAPSQQRGSARGALGFGRLFDGIVCGGVIARIVRRVVGVVVGGDVVIGVRPWRFDIRDFGLRRIGLKRFSLERIGVRRFVVVITGASCRSRRELVGRAAILEHGDEVA